MNFIELFKHLESQLGYHQFPVNDAARDLPELFESSASHHELVVRLARDIRKANRCQTMESPIAQDKTEQALSRIRLEILEGKKTDIDLYHFIEDVCVAINQYFVAPDDEDDVDENFGETPQNRASVMTFRKRRI